MELKNIIEALCDLMEYCNKKGVDIDEDENLQNVAVILDNGMANAILEAGKSQKEVELIRGYIVEGNKLQAILEGDLG